MWFEVVEKVFIYSLVSHEFGAESGRCSRCAHGAPLGH